MLYIEITDQFQIKSWGGAGIFWKRGLISIFHDDRQLRKIGEGMFRNVYSRDDLNFVVKVEYCGNIRKDNTMGDANFIAVCQSFNEINTFSRLSYSPHIPKIYASDLIILDNGNVFAVSVIEKIVEYKDLTKNEFSSRITRIRSFCWRNDIGDLHDGNFMITKEGFVIIDAGCS